MNRRGVDYSERAPNWQTFARQLKAAGYSFVGRYLSNRTKGLTPLEYAALTAEGIDVYAYYETTAGAALNGWNQGVLHAYDAFYRMATFGADKAPVFFAVDVDTTGPLVEQYFRGILSIRGVHRVGAYGGYHVLKWLFDHGLISYGAQTEAWSRVNGVLTFDSRAQIRQYTLPVHGAPTIGGISCDLNVATAIDFGQWNLSSEEEAMPLDLVYDDAAVQAAQDKLVKAGLLTRAHISSDAASVGLLVLLCSRLIDLIPEGLDLTQYELQLVKKTP